MMVSLAYDERRWGYSQDYYSGSDASGVAVMMAVMRILKANNYTGTYAIEAHAYAGEEGGLLGSKALAASYKSAGKTVRGMLDFEMVGKCVSPPIENTG